MSVVQKDIYSVLRNKKFRLWLIARFIANLARLMQALVVAWQVYDLVRKPLALGLVGLSEGIPFLTVGLWAGHMADRYEKKTQMTGGVGGLLLCAISLGLLSFSHNTVVLPIYIVIGFTGLFTSFEFTSAGSYVQMIVEEHEYPRSVAWNLSLFQAATILGPIAGGFLISHFNVTAAYGVVAVLFLISFILTSRLEKLGVQPNPSQEDSWTSIKGGLKFLGGQPLVVACMSLDMVAVLFGDVVALFPVFAEMFGVGPVGLGVLRASPAIGSLLLSLLEANRPFLKIGWKSFYRTVTVFGLAILVFALSKNFVLSVCALIVGGMADGVSVIIRQSIFQAKTPDQFRGRVSSVSSIFIRLSNEVGAFESGLVATLIGTVPSVLFGGSMTLIAVAAARVIFRKVEAKTA
jgi:MFS family permease